MMKIIFSRKGFDSSYGGSPSPIIDGKLLSLPIPANDRKGISYRHIKADGIRAYQEVMDELGIHPKQDGKVLDTDLCHLDPDLRSSTKDRLPGWRPLFGQSGKDKTHLLEGENAVKPGDIFLFFGTLQNTITVGNGLQFDKEYPRHIIWGYMVIGEIWDIGSEGNDVFKKKNADKLWAFDHPHLADSGYGPQNALFVASNKFSSKAKGAGAFRYNDRLALTKLGYPKSLWELPPFFNPSEVEISHHKDENRYRFLDNGNVLLQTVGIGQEFVVTARTADAEIKMLNWVSALIENSTTFD